MVKKIITDHMGSRFFLLLIALGFVAFLFLGCSDDKKSPPPAPLEVPTEAPSKAVNRAPLMKTIGDKITMVGASVDFTVNAIDTPDDSLAYSAVSMDISSSIPKVAGPLPDGAVFDTATKTFSWTPAAGQEGDYYLGFMVIDDGVGQMSDSEIVHVKVFPAGTADSLLISITNNDQLPANVGLNIRVEDSSHNFVPGIDIFNSDKLKVYEDGLVPDPPSESDITVYANAYDHYTLLMLDVSSSVTSDGLGKLIEAAKAFASKVISRGERLGIYYFKDDQTQLQDFIEAEEHPGVEESVLQTVDHSLDSLTSKVSTGGATNLYGAFTKGIDILNEEILKNGTSGTKAGTIAVFTDGSDNAGLVSYTDVKTAVDEFTASDRLINGMPVNCHAVAIGLNTASADVGLYSNLDSNLSDLVGASNVFKSENRDNLSETFSQAAEALASTVRWESGKYYMATYCSPKRGDFDHTIKVKITDSLGRTGESNLISYNSKDSADDCLASVDEIKKKFYDFDNDGYYSLDGSLHDQNDFNSYQWSKTNDQCVDDDGDGYFGSGCDINNDCNDADPLINPNRADGTVDGIDQNCNGGDGETAGS